MCSRERASCSCAETGRTGRARYAVRDLGADRRAAGRDQHGVHHRGGFIYADEYGYGWDKTRVGLIVLGVSLLLYVFRHVVQDRTKIRLREETPTMPEGMAAEPAAAAPG